MKDVTTHVLKLIDQVTNDLQESTKKMLTGPNLSLQNDFWINKIEISVILLKCLNNAFFVEKPISKLYKLNRSGSISLYGVPMPSNDEYRDFDFLVLYGNGFIDSCRTIEIFKSDVVKIWYTFSQVT